MKREKHFLIHELLDDPDVEVRRRATLLAGGRILRHKRWRRAAIQTLVPAALIALAALALRERTAVRPPVLSSVPTRPAVPHLTDDQLLALFPNTPVGLATVAGHKVLIFPRAADRERYVGRF